MCAAIRNSPLWEKSLLIITWGEQEGLLDHAIPPATVAPGDTLPGATHNQSGFTFEQYGPRERPLSCHDGFQKHH
jgi:phospholipase C